jgi:exopolyphosphatase/guanosine-5'-triphosphate,3'-diphosphate pyrophosphatase
MKTHKIAAIDIGSNSIKLAIIEAAASDSFTVLLQERERVRLGQETLRKRLLSPEAIARSAEAIGRFRSIADSRRVETIVAVATASVREAANAADFVKEVEAKTGVRVEVLSSIEEARLIGIAAVENFGLKKGSLLNIDIGGGSTELSLMRDSIPDKLFSMKLGAVGLTERFLFSNPPKEKELKNLHSEITLALERPQRELKNEKWQIASGTSGTILNLALLLNFQAGEKIEIQFKKLVALNEAFSKITTEERAKMPNISLQRAEVIVAGGQILEGVMRALNIQSLELCQFALREGVIIDYLRKIETESLPPVPDVEDANLRGVFAIGRRFGYEETHALQVASLAEKIFDALALTYNLQRHERTLLSAAALLHDIGSHISTESHHKHSFYLIKHSEITGFTEPEKQIIGNLARYHRGSLPKEKHQDFMQLSETEKETVWKLGAILRLAEGLDRSYENRIKDIAFRRVKSDLELEIFSDGPIESELQAAEQKKDMFETAFGCKLEIVQGNLSSRARK